MSRAHRKSKSEGSKKVGPLLNKIRETRKGALRGVVSVQNTYVRSEPSLHSPYVDRNDAALPILKWLCHVLGPPSSGPLVC